MPAIYLRSLGLLFAVVMSSDIVRATDHWGSHLPRHTCDASCGHKHLLGTADSFATGKRDQFDAGNFEETTLAPNAPVVDTHLFLSVFSADGVKQFSSGVTRSGKVEYGPLAFEVNSTSREMVTEFRMLVDGAAAHPETFEVGTDWQANGINNEQGWSRTVQWNCPPLGRHSIQFEVRLNDRLVTSEQLWIEIVPPLKPEVVAVGTNEAGTAPIKSGKIVTIAPRNRGSAS